LAKLLQPGQQAPDFEFTSSDHGLVRLEDFHGKMTTLIFLAQPIEERAEALRRFQERLSDFSDRGYGVVVVSPEQTDALSAFARNNEFNFHILSSFQTGISVAYLYGASDDSGHTENAVFLLDEAGLVRRTYSNDQYPDLPNPAICLRALTKIAETPRPWPVEEQDWHRGELTADVTLIEYADYECRPCRENHHLLSRILPDYGNRIVLIHRHLPLKPLHPLAPLAAEAAESAGAQGCFWEMHDRLFLAEGALEREHLDSYAKEIGLNFDQFTADLDSARFTDRIKEQFLRAIKCKIKLTPTLFINGILYEGPRTESGFRSVIDPLLESIKALKDRHGK